MVGYKSYITAEHVAKMPYLKFCVKESLRYLILILVYSINLGISEISINTQVIIQNRTFSLARYLGLSADYSPSRATGQ